MREAYSADTDLAVGIGQLIVTEDIVIDHIGGSIGDTDVAVSAAVIQGYPAGSGVLDRSAWEADIRDETAFLVPFLRSQYIVSASVEDTGRLIDIEDSGTDAVNVAVAGIDDAVIE